MAVGVISNADATQYEGKITIFVVLSCITAGMGRVNFGYDIGVPGGVTSMDSFLKEFFPKVCTGECSKTKTSATIYCKFDRQLLTAFTSSMYISGLIITTLFASSFTEKFVRRFSMLLGEAIFVTGAAIGGAAVNLFMVILARVLLRVALGFSTLAVPIYLSEMAPSKYRGLFSNGFQFLLVLGALISSIINYSIEKISGGWGWRISFALAMVPSLLLTLLGAIFLPQTPNSLIQQGKDPKNVKKLLQKIRGIDDVSKELEDIIKATDASKALKHPFKTILEPKYRPQLVMAIFNSLYRSSSKSRG